MSGSLGLALWGAAGREPQAVASAAGSKAYNVDSSKCDLAPRLVMVAVAPCQALQECSMSVLERIQAEVEGHPIVLFMKGTAQFPMCGFSSRSVQALKA